MRPRFHRRGCFSFISNASGFWNGVLGFLKTIVWPAFILYEMFKSFYNWLI